MRVAAIILVCCASLAFAIRNCPRNEEWTECKGCELSCGQDENTPCPAKCGPPGCECVASKGFRRNAQGKCVLKSQCGSGSKNCPRNMEYKECGTACPETCEDDGPKQCTKQCVAGCFCKKGYLLQWQHGKCVRKEECLGPKKCPRNMEFKECGTACPETCADAGAPRQCTKQCVKGCFCKRGFVLEHEYGDCIRKSACRG